MPSKAQHDDRRLCILGSGRSTVDALEAVDRPEQPAGIMGTGCADFSLDDLIPPIDSDPN